MLKIQDGIATRDPLPQFLIGLMPESLADLSWTDPALGVQGLAWWPEENGDVELGTNKKWGAEVLTLDADRKVVIVTHKQVNMTAEDLVERTAQQTASAYAERDRLMAIATARIAPLQDAVDLDDATDGEIALLKKWKQYRIALNRIQTQEGFPPDITWPEQPE